jgi:hypothetical protein
MIRTKAFFYARSRWRIRGEQPMSASRIDPRPPAAARSAWAGAPHARGATSSSNMGSGTRAAGHAAHRSCTNYGATVVLDLGVALVCIA